MRSLRSLAALELKLPLLISGLLVIVIGGFSWGAYTEVRDVTLGAAGQHLARVTTQLVASLQAGGPQRSAEVRQPADQAVVREYLARPGGASRAAARATLERLTSRDSLNAAVELWNAAGERVLAVGPALAALDALATQALTAQVTDTGATLGPLRVIGDARWMMPSGPDARQERAHQERVSLARVRGSVHTAGLSVLVLTGTVSDEAEAQLMEEGADDYVRKPLEPARFVARVKAALRRAGS